uniref:Uncharacterized protein n=1 Tax=Romanomermis culicivorax TaxID=13658 RepID=A0A915IJ87_ROMCU
MLQRKTSPTPEQPLRKTCNVEHKCRAIFSTISSLIGKKLTSNSTKDNAGDEKTSFKHCLVLILLREPKKSETLTSITSKKFLKKITGFFEKCRNLYLLGGQITAHFCDQEDDMQIDLR